MTQKQISYPENYPDEYKQWFVEFLWKQFIVSEGVLIPRLETEVLIKRVQKFLKNFHEKKIIVDIGSGSWIIGTSLAHIADELFFIDISKEALTIAQKNFKNYFPEKNANFLHSSLLDNFENIKNEKIIFVTNLPYIKNNDWWNMSEDTIFEPKIALFGGENTWFELYENLFEQINTKHFSGKLFIEFWFDQREVAEKIIKQYPHWQYDFFADYAGIERFCEITL